ncbi:hypothetical protein SNARM312S_07675 [Streptomyces narbonensis]
MSPGPPGRVSKRARSGVMPTPPASSRTLRRVRRWAVSAPKGPEARTRVPGRRRRIRRVWSPSALTVIRRVSSRTGAGQGQGRRPEPAPEEAPAEELAGFGAQPGHSPALDEDGDDPGALVADLGDPQLVPEGGADGDDDPVPDEEDADGRVGHRPEPDGEEAPGDVGARELVDEAERCGEEAAQVDGPPGLVPDAAADGPGRGDADGGEEGGAGGGGGDRPVGEEVPGGGDEVRVGVHGVPAEREEGVGGDETEDVTAAEGVPAGEPVGADAVLDGRDAGHEQEEDEDAIAGEEPGEVGAGREEGVEAGGGPGLEAPEERDRSGPGDDPGPQPLGGEPEGGDGSGDAHALRPGGRGDARWLRPGGRGDAHALRRAGAGTGAGTGARAPGARGAAGGVGAGWSGSGT